MATSLGNHNSNCAHARQRRCRCTGCGGTEHGYGGWLDLAADPEARHERRTAVEVAWRHAYKPRRSAQNQNQAARAAGTDSARLDVTDWMADQSADGGTTRQRTPASEWRSERVSRPATEISPPGVTDRSSSRRTAVGGEGEAGSEDLVEPAVAISDPVRVVATLAQVLAQSTWSEITPQLGADRAEASKISRQMAEHGWCDILVGLVMVVEQAQDLLHLPAGMAKDLISKVVLGSSMHDKRPDVTEAVVGMVVDKVWNAFVVALSGGVPLLAALTRDGTLRYLRILTVFICPAPEAHREVREHALRPLGDDVKHILTEDSKAKLSKLFRQWTFGVS